MSPGFDVASLAPALDALASLAGGAWSLAPADEDGVPVVANGQVVARLRPAEPAETAAALARALGWAADRQLTVQDLARQTARSWQELTFLHRMATRLDELPRDDDAMPALLGELARVLGAGAGWIVVPGARARTWSLDGTPPPDGLPDLASGIQASGMALAVATAADVPEDVDPEDAEAFAPHLPLVVAPMLDQGDPIGLIALARPRDGAPWSSFAAKMVFSAAAMGAGVLHRARLMDETRRSAALRRELEVARTIQDGLRPRSAPARHDLTAWGWRREATAVGGDLYGWWGEDRPDAPMWFYVGDVSGHGVGAALIMSNAYAVLRTVCRAEDDAARAADRFNDQICEDIEDAPEYLTLALLRYDPTARALSHVGMGHPPVLLLPAGAAAPTTLSGDGLPAGMFGGTGYRASSCEVADGDLLLAFTDGLIEAERPDGEPFGLDRLAAALAAGRDLPLPELGAALVAAVEAFTGEVELSDDQTLLLVRF